MRNEIILFGRICIFSREPYHLAWRDEEQKRRAGQDVSAMTLQFLDWLEYTAIESGAEVVAAIR
jgi:hypothetical protein